MNLFTLTCSFLVVFWTGVDSQSCTADSGLRCIPYSEAPQYLSLYKNGNPCFTYQSAKWCIVAILEDGSASLNSCSCDNPPAAGATCSVKPPAMRRRTRRACRRSKRSYCQLGTDHTMCQYPCGVNTTTCGQTLCSRGLNGAQQKIILDKHNDLRRMVAKGEETLGFPGPQPPATDMYELKWDRELAIVAQRWVDQCDAEAHDANRKSRRFEVGQNWAGGSASYKITDRDLAGFVQLWYDEVADWNPDNIDDYTWDNNNGVVGHYTAVAWGNTKLVGCGYIAWQEGEDTYKDALVCNYGPAGNWIGGVMYTNGTTASDCPNQVNDGLCV